ncbi:MAG: hypothetical protein HUU01_04980 [Saprospiraceae bacterium]|nr:hypothetical protein [Saprospiraceae bacterium]
MSEYKETIASRVSPDLKREILNEAEEHGITASAYVENLLQNRQTTMDWLDRVGDLEHRVEMLEIAQEAHPDFSGITRSYFSKKAVPLLDEEKDLDDLDESEIKVPKIPEPPATLALAGEAYAEAAVYISRLKEEYPDQSDQELIVLALWTAIRNEKNFFQIIIKQAPDTKEKRLQKIGEYGD